MNFLLLLVLIGVCTNVLCNENQKTDKKDKEDKLEEQNDNKTDNDEKTDEAIYDEIGEKFLSLLREDLRMKILKNKATNEGILDAAKYQKQHLTQEELAEVQAALMQAMQPLFGKFVSELANSVDERDKLELDGPAKASKKPVTEDKAEGELSKEEKTKTDKKKPPKKEKDEGQKVKKEKIKVKLDPDKTEKPKPKKDKDEKAKKDTEKVTKKEDKVKKEKKDTKQKEEL